MYLVVDYDAISDMLDNNPPMNGLADYDAAIAMNLEAAYRIADSFIMEQEVSQVVIIPLDDTKVLAATVKPVHEVLCWPEDEPKPIIPDYNPDYDEDCEDFE